MVGLLISINFGALNLKLIYTFVRFKIKGIIVWKRCLVRNYSD